MLVFELENGIPESKIHVHTRVRMLEPFLADLERSRHIHTFGQRKSIYVNAQRNEKRRENILVMKDGHTVVGPSLSPTKKPINYLLFEFFFSDSTKLAGLDDITKYDHIRKALTHLIIIRNLCQLTANAFCFTCNYRPSKVYMNTLVQTAASVMKRGTPVPYFLEALTWWRVKFHRITAMLIHLWYARCTSAYRRTANGARGGGWSP